MWENFLADCAYYHLVIKRAVTTTGNASVGVVISAFAKVVILKPLKIHLVDIATLFGNSEECI